MLWVHPQGISKRALSPEGIMIIPTSGSFRTQFPAHWLGVRRDVGAALSLGASAVSRVGEKDEPFTL